MTPRLILDADGVFVDFVKGFLTAVKAATGKDFTQSQITSFDISKSLGLTDEEAQATYAQITKGWCLNLDPIPGAIEWIQRLNLISDIYIVTSPLSSLDTWASERTKWIKEHLGFSKNRVMSGSAKQICRADFFVDDSAENCEAWNAENSGTAVMWKSPWNEKHPWLGHRFNEWHKLEALIQGKDPV